MMSAANLRNVSRYADGAYHCTIDIDGEACIYVARAGDPAPLNIWILDRIEAHLAAGNVIPAFVAPEA